MAIITTFFCFLFFFFLNTAGLPVRTSYASVVFVGQILKICANIILYIKEIDMDILATCAYLNTYRRNGPEHFVGVFCLS